MNAAQSGAAQSGDAGMRQELRALEVLAGPFPAFEPDTAPEQPAELFLTWLRLAIDAGVPEPHAMTLSTVDADGHADARTLILKGVDADGFHFAVSRLSPKGRQIEARPHVALTFHWQALGRQVRIRGEALDMGPAAGPADFLARSIAARAAVLSARQSDVLADERDLDAQLAERHRRLLDEPQSVAKHWAAYAVRPAEVEFWQGSEDRRHVRLRYRREGVAWLRERLWP